MSLQPKEIKRLYTKEELGIAYSIQNIFATAPNPAELTKIKKEFLTIPKIKNFVEDIHRRIVQEVLVPFESRAEGTMFSALFFGYSASMLDTLKFHHSRFVEALIIIDTQLSRLDKDSENYKIQIQIVNTCLLSALQQYAKFLPWHPASSLYIELVELYPQYSFNREPIVSSKANPGYLEVYFARDVCIDSFRMQLADLKKQIMELRAKKTTPCQDGNLVVVSDSKMVVDPAVSASNTMVTESVAGIGLFANQAANQSVDESKVVYKSSGV